MPPSGHCGVKMVPHCSHVSYTLTLSHTHSHTCTLTFRLAYIRRRGWCVEGVVSEWYAEDNVSSVRYYPQCGHMFVTCWSHDIHLPGSPVYCACWSPDASHVLYGSGKSLIVRPLQPAMKPAQWKAHEGLVLAVDWSLANNHIISGGEDRKYKVS